MAQSRLILREEMTGCLECEAGTLATEESLVKNTFLQLFQPQYVTTFVQPEKETIKVRNEIRAVRFHIVRTAISLIRNSKTTKQN